MLLSRCILLFFALLAAGAGQAQITYVGAEQASVAATGTITFQGVGTEPNTTAGCPATISPSTPAGTKGDLLIAVVVSIDNGTLAPSMGWNTQFSGDQANHLSRVYYRYADGSAADNLTVTKTVTCTVNMHGQVARFNGVDPVTPFEPTVLSNFQNSTAINHGGGTINATVANSMSLFAITTSDDNTSNTPGGGFSEAFDSSSNPGGANNDTEVALYYRQETTTGNKGPFSTTMGAADPNYGIFMILRSMANGITIRVPAGTLANDVMVASIAARPCSGTSGNACTTTITQPGPWTLVNPVNQPTGGGTGGYGNILYVYYRVASGAEPAAYTWSLGGNPVNNGAVGGILSFSGVDTTIPIVDSLGALTNSGSTHVAPQINTGTVTNTWLVSSHSSNSSTTWTTPGGMNKRVDAPSLTPTNDLGLAISMHTELRAAAGLTGTRSSSYTTPGTPANDTGATHMLALRPAASVNHYAISVLSNTVANCDYAEVTITAHNAADAAVNPPASRTVTLSVSFGAATAVWQSPKVSGSGTWTPTGATATYAWPGNESSFTVRLRQSAVVSLTVNANDTFVSEAGGTEDPTINFVNSVFRISNGANAALSIGTQISGKRSDTGFNTQSLFLQAIRTDTVTGACTSLFPNGAEVDIGVGAQCNNPAVCTRNVTLTTQTGGGSPTGNFIPAGAGTYPATIRFRFTNANAEAPFYFSYADAGQITLQFRHITAAPAVTIAGTSNAFVVRPFGLAFRGANAATAIQHGTLPTSALLAAAGDNFTMTVAGYQWAASEDANNDGIPDAGVNITDNGTVPNFAATAAVGRSANLPGVALGTVSRGVACAGAASIALAGGSGTAGDWCYSEVGNVIFTADATNYLSAGVNITGNSGLDGVAGGGYVGRFRPKNFAISGVPTVTNRSAAACSPASAFTYMNEALALAFTLVARNTQGATTQNYNGVYAKLGIGTFANFSFGAKSGTTDLIARVDSGANPVGSWSNGVAGITVTTGILRAMPDNPDGPYAAVQFGIAPVDSDGVAMNTLDFDADGNTVNERANLGVTTEVRFGRLRLANAMGSSLLDLPLPLSTQYYDGSFFVTNTADSCTTLAASDIAFSFLAATPNLVACETQLNPSGTIAFASGTAAVRLTKPASTNDGAVDLTVNLGAVASGNTCTSGTSSPATSANKTWLQGNWGSGAYGENPRARATFGIFKNADQFIYYREIY